MKLIGILIITNALILTGWHVASTNGSKWVISVCLVAVFVGLALTFQDRITELTIKGVGSIKAATEQAEEKLNEIEVIRKRVESQSATIDLVAKDAKDARELTEEIKKKGEEVEKKVKDINASVEATNAKSKELGALLDFTNTVVAAQSDSRVAFDRLEKWANTQGFPYAKEASQAWIKVMNDHSSGMYSSGFASPWNKEFEPAKLDIVALAQQYAAAPDVLKAPILEYIWKRDDIPKKTRMEFLVGVLQSDPSLTAVEYAGRYFTEGASLKIKPLAVSYLVQWWSEHKSEIK